MGQREFLQATQSLCRPIRQSLAALPVRDMQDITEIRLRRGMPLTVTCRGSPLFLRENRLCTFPQNAFAVTEQMLTESFECICDYSVHAHMTDLQKGFITLKGGHRAGIGGTAVYDGGQLHTVKDIACINLRIANQKIGTADGIYNRYYTGGIPSVLIAGPPGSGKTTVLRDLARQLSGEQRGRFLRTVLCDERGELAAVWQGKAQNDVGLNCDVLTGYRKAEAILIALRCFNPQMIVCDEVGETREIAAVRQGLNAGTAFALSVHIESKEALLQREAVRELLLTRAFSGVALLCRDFSVSQFLDAKELLNEMAGGSIAGVLRCPFGVATLPQNRQTGKIS